MILFTQFYLPPLTSYDRSGVNNVAFMVASAPRHHHINARHQLHVLHLHLNPLRVSVVLAARSRHLDFTRQPHATRASTHLGCQRSCSSPPPLS